MSVETPGADAERVFTHPVKSKPAGEGTSASSEVGSGDFLSAVMAKMSGRSVPGRVRSDVWHYTTADGLLGILESNHIWASAPQVLNDESEVEYGVAIVREALTQIEHEQLLPDHALELLHEIVDDGWVERMQSEVFVTSTSRDGDLLNQWQGYANADGFAVSFDTNGAWGTRTVLAEDGRPSSTGLPTILTPVIADWYPVIYDRPAQLLQARDALLWNGAMVSGADGEPVARENRSRALSMVRLMLSVIPFVMKHPAFVDEREVRYVGGATDQQVRFRTAGGRVIPYTVLGLLDPSKQVNQEDASFPLTAITCGPGCRPGTADIVKRLLRSHGYDHVPVITSSIPYLGRG
jgi:hypothetical protein